MATSFIIRDGLPTDIDNCLNLDRTYATNYVWQMTVSEAGGGYGVAFRKERLPRTMEVEYPASRGRLQLALKRSDCFLVAVDKEEPITFGYLVMHHDPAHKIALVHELVVDRDHRRGKIGTRLLNVACRWADERGLTQLMIETQTKNYPSIAFFEGYGLSFCGFNDQYFRNKDIAVFFGQSLR